jgi:DNA processing protein
MDKTEHDALLALTLSEGFGQATIQRCIDAFGGADAALGASVHSLAGLDQVGAQRARKLRSALDQTLRNGVVQTEREHIDAHGVHLIGLNDEAYPRLLKHIPDPPALLWVRGRMIEEDALGLGIVGSRRCTHYGREQADRFASLCAQSGLCIVSGGARGIDGAAHRAALRAGGRTIAVIGSGLAQPYPNDHKDLFDEIAHPGAGDDPGAGEGHGAVVSEFPMMTPPNAQNFPRRNRIISGLSLGVLVIEAATRSGALITARLAVEEHHRELMAVPGRVDAQSSAGCHKIIREGWATLVTSPADVLDALGEAGQMLKAGLRREEPGGDQAPPKDIGLTDPQRKILEAMSGSSSLDQLVARTGLLIQNVQAELTMLEVRGAVRRQGGLFSRKKA